MKAFKMAQPKTLGGAVGVLGSADLKAEVLAGGTDLLALIKDQVAQPDVLVNIKGLEGLGAIEKTPRGLEIGALVKLADLATHQEVVRSWPAIAATLRETATPQIRNVGTVAGNLCQRPRCWYFRNEHYDCKKKGGTRCFAHDGENEYHAVFGNGICCIVHPSNLAGPLLAYDAQIEIASGGALRTVPAADFFVTPDVDVKRENILEPDEIVTRIILPEGSANPKSTYVETREKQSFDWALCGVTVALTMQDKEVAGARIVFNAIAPTPLRRPDLEGMLEGKRLSDQTIDRLCDAAALGANALEQNAYKITLMKAVLRRALRQVKEAS